MPKPKPEPKCDKCKHCMLWEPDGSLYCKLEDDRMLSIYELAAGVPSWCPLRKEKHNA